MPYNFPPHHYLTAMQRFDPGNISTCGSLAQNSASNHFLEALSQFNFPTTSQQYLEMMSMLRKVSPSAIVYPELNKPITEETFNSNMFISTKPSNNASAPCNGNKDSIMSDISASTNPLLALGDLSLYGLGSIKQNKSEFCQQTYTHSPLASAYINNHADIFKQLEQLKSTLNNDICSVNRGIASLQSGRQQAQQNMSTSITTFSPISSDNTLLYDKNQQSYPNISTEGQHNQTPSNISSSYVGASTKSEADNKKDSLSSKNSTLSCISNIPTRLPSPFNNNSQIKKSQVAMKPNYSMPNDTFCITDVGICYPKSKNISSLTNESSTNMGIVYPKKGDARVSPTTAKKTNESETIRACSEVYLPKQCKKICSNLFLTNTKSSAAMNTGKPCIKQNISPKTSNNTAINQSQQLKQTKNLSGNKYLSEAQSSIFNQKTQSREGISSSNKKNQSLKAKEVDNQIKNLANKSNSNLSFPPHVTRPENPLKRFVQNISNNSNTLVQPTTKPIASETHTLPIIPITSTIELKKRIELNASSLSYAENALSIRQVENKQNPSGGGVFIIEANVNQKKLAIGTPTKRYFEIEKCVNPSLRVL